MTSIPTFSQQKQSHKSNTTDENTSDDSLLLMADTFEDQAPLLNINDEDFIRNEHDIPLQIRLSPTHCHVPDENFDYVARNRLIAVLALCLAFMSIEIIGGILSNSIAVITDAAHMCVDAVSFMVSLAAIYLAKKRPTQKFSFGFIRAEVLGALLSVLTIWVATGILVYMAIERCIDRSFEVRPTQMIVVASCGVLFNIVMFFVLHGNACGHSLPHHGHSHDDHVLVVDVVSGHSHEHLTSSKNINVQAAIIHVIGDFVQSVGVLLAAILIKIKPEYKLADPICTFIFSVLVLITTVTIMRDIVHVLMEGVPSNVNYKQIVADLFRLSGVRDAHSLHIWSLSLQKTALSVHLAIDNDQDYLTVLNDAQEMLRREHSITRVTIQIEPYDEQMMNSCESCRRPES